ncbi:MAG: hypothetical protein NVS3B10_00170 [Polyangiales bacterium]
MATFNVTGATNASPIVITTSAPHGLQTQNAVTVAGVLGNTAANGTFQIIALTATTFSLDGSTGSGAYAGGGTVLGPLGRISGTVALLNYDFVQRLAAMSPAVTLVDGKILLGQQHVMEQSSAPRVVFVPDFSDWEPGGPSSYGGTDNRAGYPIPAGEKLLQTQQRAIATELLQFRIHVWGIASPPDPDGGDYDATQVLYHALINTFGSVAKARFRLFTGRWTSSSPSNAHVSNYGQEFVFAARMPTPVLDAVLPIQTGNHLGITNKFQPGDGGTPEVGCAT